MHISNTAKSIPNNPKITIQLNSPAIDSPQNLRSPAFSRKGGRRDKGGDSLKSSGERSVEKSLKYTKILPRDWKNDVSEVRSEVHIIRLLTEKLEDSQETVVHKGRSRSQNK